MEDLDSILEVPEHRREALKGIVDRLLTCRRVVLTTHVNADEDAAGSVAAVAAWLDVREIEVTIVNPTPYPEGLHFLLHREGLLAAPGSAAARRAIESADMVLVLDTGEPKRIGEVADLIPSSRTFVVDHHPPGPEGLGQGGVLDPAAAATGELVFDMMRIAAEAWSPEVALPTYVAIVGDTGSFRYSNTSPRVHAIVAQLLQHGVEPEEVFRRLFATTTPRRLELLREALGALEHDPQLGMSWMALPLALTARVGAEAEDFDGLIDHARSIRGTEVALLIRETEPGRTKVSFRSSGDFDVNEVAREFGGGGHVKASGATIEGPFEETVGALLAAVRERLHGPGGGPPRG